MEAYKGFDKELRCRGFQYEVGKEYKEDRAEICECGFHACKNPFDVFAYYPPADSRYCKVDLDANGQTDNDSKRVGKRIKILREIGLSDFIEAGVEYIKEKVDWENSKESNTGDRSAATNTGNQSAATNTGNRSAATNTGNQSAATNTGYQSVATNTGNQSAATNTGDWSAAMNTGDRSAAVVNGKDSIAIAIGLDSKAKGAVGCFLTLAEWKKTDDEWHLMDVKAVKVDGKRIKADVFYTLKEGRFMEVDEAGKSTEAGN